MKLPDSFMPDKDLEGKVDVLLSTPDFNEQGLAIAVEDSTAVNRGKIYVWEPSMIRPELVNERKYMVIDFCYHDSQLYDCGAYTRVSNALTDDELLTQLSAAYSLCHYNGELVYSNLGTIYSGDSKLKERLGCVFALRTHNGELYDAGTEQCVYSTMKNKFVAKRDDTIRALCSHQGSLYDAGHYMGVKNTYTNETVAERAHIIYALCSFRGTLLEGGTSGMVTDVFSDKLLLDFGYSTVTALEMIPVSLVKNLVNFRKKS
ncbi:hypothetical protein FJZ53_00920 [Candidatus Woesearchaeota archaeon]|nr:hypothetical protein [Candidatus Woesearchaeota archaeon]